MKRGHPGGNKARNTKKVGPDYPEELYRLPWGAEMDSFHGDKTGKTMHTPNATTFAPEIPLHEKGYDELWKGKS
jgi:hypothetical protein